MKIKRETTTYRTERNPVEIIQEQNHSKRCLFFLSKTTKPTMKIKEKNLSFTKLNQTHLNHKKNKKAHFIKNKFTIHYPIKTSKTHILKHRKKRRKTTNTKFKKRRKSERRQAGRHTSREQPMVVTTAAVT
jgi:hypothetical protein